MPSSLDIEPGLLESPTVSPTARPSISLFMPVYRDQSTVRALTEKAIRVLTEVAEQFEIVIVDDGSPDASGAIADELARQHDCVTVVHHPRNLGYGRALQTGFDVARRFEWVCFLDGDDQYDVRELRHLAQILPRYDLVVTFRRRKIYGPSRVFISWIYNQLVRRAFGSPFRDHSSGMKLIRREVVDELRLISDSPFIGAEITVRALYQGRRIGEAAISMYPRVEGSSSIINLRNIRESIIDLIRVKRELATNVAR